MRARVWAATAALGALLALATARDQDFEFDDNVEASPGAAHVRRPRRYIYDPQNSLCQALVCKKREVCVLRDTFTALCANKKDILRRGDVIVSASSTNGAWDGAGGGASSGAADGAAWERDDDDDVFYDGGARIDTPDLPDTPDPDSKPERCVGCPARVRARFLCGSDNRTYSSLCRLDLHNCVRRPARPVRPACRGFCPCARRTGPHRTGPRRAPARSRPRNDDYDDDWRRRKSDSGHNEVLSERSSRRRLSQGSEGCALDKMANRLLDWFSVLMEEAGATTAPEKGFPADCKPEVRWMFAHLDADGDGLLSAANLYSLRHDERERCLRPFLAACGGEGGEEGGEEGVARAAWCGCLRRAARPCSALARAHPDPHPGAYVPACDARGFYRPRQCHAALGVCWCVDAHGVELPGSRGKGAPACPGDKSSAAVSNETAAGAGERDADEADGGAEGEAPADDEDAAGSGDQELRF